jgi:hypothetical protein
MQSRLRGQKQPTDVSCVLRNLWPKQDNVKHEFLN